MIRFILKNDFSTRYIDDKQLSFLLKLNRRLFFLKLLLKIYVFAAKYKLKVNFKYPAYSFLRKTIFNMSFATSLVINYFVWQERSLLSASFIFQRCVLHLVLLGGG